MGSIRAFRHGNHFGVVILRTRGLRQSAGVSTLP
jgi:hypothetical protein